MEKLVHIFSSHRASENTQRKREYRILEREREKMYTGMERVRDCRLGSRGKDDGFCFEPRKYALGIDCNQDLIGKRQVLVIRRNGR